MSKPVSLDPGGVRSPMQAERGASSAASGSTFFDAVLGAPAIVVVALPACMLLAMLAGASRWVAALGFAWGGSIVWGTLASSALAVALAAPVAVGVAVLLSDLAPHRARRPLGLAVEVVAAVPSVVYGFWALEVLLPAVHAVHQAGPGALVAELGEGVTAAGIVLAVMIVPTIASVSREVLVAVPDGYRDAARGLGARPWDVVRVAVLPSARRGIAGAVLLGFTRAIGETVAVAMVLHGARHLPSAPARGPYTMASSVLEGFLLRPSGLGAAALLEIAFVLLAATLGTNLAARLLVERAKLAMRRLA